MIVKNGSMIFGIMRILGSTESMTLIKIDGSQRQNSGNFSVYTAGTENVIGTTIYDQKIVMRVGTGSTAPTVNDYCLAADDTNDTLTCTFAAISRSSTGNPIYMYSFTNSGSTAFTVSEVGLFWHYNSDFVMLGREVLTSPRVVQPNETVTFSYEIAFN